MFYDIDSYVQFYKTFIYIIYITIGVFPEDFDCSSYAHKSFITLAPDVFKNQLLSPNYIPHTHSPRFIQGGCYFRFNVLMNCKQGPEANVYNFLQS